MPQSEMCRLIYVAGNNGAGKTTVTRLLTKSLGGQMLLSNAADNTYCKDIHRSPARYAFEAQVSFLVSKVERITTAFRNRPQFLIVDRSPYEDAEIFARYWFSSGYIDARAFKTYQQVATTALAVLAQPSTLIYLHASLDTLKTRILTRLRPHERSYAGDFLAQLQRRYAPWSKRFRLCPTIDVNMERTNFLGPDGPNDLSKLRKQLLTVLKGR